MNLITVSRLGTNPYGLSAEECSPDAIAATAKRMAMDEARRNRSEVAAYVDGEYAGTALPDGRWQGAAAN